MLAGHWAPACKLGQRLIYQFRQSLMNCGIIIAITLPLPVCLSLSLSLSPFRIDRQTLQNHHCTIAAAHSPRNRLPPLLAAHGPLAGGAKRAVEWPRWRGPALGDGISVGVGTAPIGGLDSAADESVKRASLEISHLGGAAHLRQLQFGCRQCRGRRSKRRRVRGCFCCCCCGECRQRRSGRRGTAVALMMLIGREKRRRGGGGTRCA